MRTYGQYCGVAKAADVITERWALLIVRDLLVAPMRFGQLRESLAAPSNMLSTRLKELESAGVVERAAAPRPGGGVVYQLTEYGRDLEPVVDAIGRWGARRMDTRRPDERVTDQSLASALRCGWTGHATRRTVWRVTAGPATAWAITEPDGFEFGGGEPPEPPTVNLSGPGFRRLLAGEVGDPGKGPTLVVEPGGRSATRHLAEFRRAFSMPLDGLDG